MMTQGTQKLILGTAFLGTNQLPPGEWEGVAYCSSTVIANKPMLVFVDSIGGKNQVILELEVLVTE